MSLKNVCYFCSCKKKLLQGRMVGKFCDQLRCQRLIPHLYLLMLVQPCVEGYGSTDYQERMLCTNIKWFCNTIRLQWPWCEEKRRKEFHGFRYHTWWTWTSKHQQLLDLIRVKRSKVLFAERLGKAGVLGENTTTKSQRKTKIIISFFFLALECGSDLQTKNWYNSKWVTLNKGTKCCFHLCQWKSGIIQITSMNLLS